MQEVLPVSDGIDDGFEMPLGPFGLKRFKTEVAFKLYLQRRIEASVRHKDVSSAQRVAAVVVESMTLV